MTVQVILVGASRRIPCYTNRPIILLMLRLISRLELYMVSLVSIQYSRSMVQVMFSWLLYDDDPRGGGVISQDVRAFGLWTRKFHLGQGKVRTYCRRGPK